MKYTIGAYLTNPRPTHRLHVIISQTKLYKHSIYKQSQKYFDLLSLTFIRIRCFMFYPSLSSLSPVSPLYRPPPPQAEVPLIVYDSLDCRNAHYPPSKLHSSDRVQYLVCFNRGAVHLTTKSVKKVKCQSVTF